MSKTLQLTLPVMLHFDSEIPLFLATKERLEALGDKYGVPTHVGAFLPYMPGHSRKPASFDKQYANQQKHGLPIRLVETGIDSQNSLAYVPGNPTFRPDVRSEYESTLEQVARLRDLDPNPVDNLVVAPHIAAQVTDELKEGDFSRMGLYSPADFAKLRSQLFDQTQSRFGQLSDQARTLGLRLAIENAPPVTFADYGFWSGGSRQSKLELRYHGFNGLGDIVYISRGNQVIDLTHLAGAIDTPKAFTRNGTPTDTLFTVMGVSSWDEFSQRVGNYEDHLANAVGIHLSGVEGIGVRLGKDTPEARMWGGAGTLPNLLTLDQYASFVEFSIERGIPVAIEEDFITNDKPAAQLDYKEADEFLEPVLKRLQSRRAK